MFWQKRKDGRVYVFEMVGGKQRAIPRARIKHLDGQPDFVIQNYVDSMSPRVAPVLLSDSLTALLERQLDRRQRLNPNPVTIERAKSVMLRFVFPYFLSHTPPLTDPNTWGPVAAGLIDYLEAKKVSPDNIIKCNAALRGFWKWARESGIVVSPAELTLLPPLKQKNPTPLKFNLMPSQVLSFARSADPEMAFLALTGFFFSLRTQETLALTGNEFKAGSVASELECCRVMLRHGLYSKFAVLVSKQYSKGSGDKKAAPNADSKGWVACFNEDAARLLVELLKQLPKHGNEPLSNYHVGHALYRWRHSGIPGVTLKDLRRASLYWLGHHTDFGLIELKSHARHEHSQTTELYLRRPEDLTIDAGDLDLEA